MKLYQIITLVCLFAYERVYAATNDPAVVSAIIAIYKKTTTTKNSDPSISKNIQSLTNTVATDLEKVNGAHYHLRQLQICAPTCATLCPALGEAYCAAVCNCPKRRFLHSTHDVVEEQQEITELEQDEDDVISMHQLDHHEEDIKEESQRMLKDDKDPLLGNPCNCKISSDEETKIYLKNAGIPIPEYGSYTIYKCDDMYLDECVKHLD